MTAIARKLAGSFWAWLALIVCIRLIALCLADGDLGPDEVQYWYWSRDPDFGYFSKPPMIAWIIAATTGLFGNGEWAVRLAAPLLHAGTASILYLLARRAFDERVALLAGLGWLTLPGASVSSFLMTTDAPLLLFWSGGLYFLFRITEARGIAVRDFIAMGAMIGLGLLSKYAMLYFPVALAVAILVSPQARRAVLRPALLASFAVALAIFSPNIAWNAAHDFQTVAHTAANANWDASLFKPGQLAAFLGAQFAVFGLIAFGALVMIMVRWPAFSDGEARARLTTLLVFTATPLLIVSTQALISRAHANWAAAAYPAGIVLISAALCAAGRQRILFASLAVNSAIALFVVVAVTNFQLLDRIGASGAVAELRGWREMTTQIAAAANKDDYDAILFDDRSMIGEMLYYQRAEDFEIAALDPNAGVHHHYEAFIPFDPRAHRRSLFVSILDNDAHVDHRFSQINDLGSVSGGLGRGRSRDFHLFEIAGYYGRGAAPAEPAPSEPSSP